MSTLFVNTITPNSGDTVTISGSLSTTGKLTIGDASTDTVAFEAEISSSLIPDVGATYALGTMANSWGSLHVHGLAHLHTASINVVSSSLIPNADETYDLGSSSKRWRTAHIDRIDNGILPLSISSSIDISAHITASGNISSSGAVFASGLTLDGSSGQGNITASNGHFNETVSTANLTVNSSGSIDILEVRTISASALPTSEATANSGQLFTLSGSQIPLSGSVAEINVFSASLFVFLKP